jgi:hypothetical protein
MSKLNLCARSGNICLTTTREILLCRYHVPRSWLKPGGNLLVVLEEYGGDLAGVALATRTT